MKRYIKKQKILIVDDSEINRSILADMLNDEYEILEAEDGEKGVTILQQYSAELSVVLLDIVMPKMDGFEVLVMMNKYHWIEDVPVIMISAENSVSYMERAFELGITDYISRPFDAYIVRKRVVNTILAHSKQKKLMGMVADQMFEKEKNSNLLITILSHIVEFRNHESGLHVFHINAISEHLLKTLVQKTNKYGITSKDISLISMASSLHDIGKIGISDKILNKPDKLTADEFEIMRTHSMLGASMIDALPFYKEEALVKFAYEICRWHHERFDGKGYPDGLKGEDIPISAQVVSIADAYDALTSDRVYKKAYTHEEAMDMIKNGECGQFNPLLLECLEDIEYFLKNELKLNSLSLKTEQETKKIVEDMLYDEELTASDRTISLLEHERMKYQFFASMSEEIQFEYVSMPSMITFSEMGAAKLGIPGKILNPFFDDNFLDAIGRDNVANLSEALRNTTPDAPVIQYEGFVTIDKRPRWNKFICRATWSNDANPVYLGSIGKITDIHDTYTKISDLRREASHDSLTGLLNHKYARRLIESKLEHFKKNDYAMLIIDLDKFGDSNNQFGHMFGDKVLKYVAASIVNIIRSDDIAARVGGDEFLIFIKYQPGADAFIHRIYKNVTGSYKNFEITFSMGIAIASQVGRNYDRLFHCADQALYAAKNNGRKQYCFYDESMEGQLTSITPIENADDNGGYED